MSDPLVVTVILNTNRREDTLACLASLARADCARHAILVLDNASTDGSVEAIRAGFPAVIVLPLAENRGYAGNNNVGIRHALDLGAEWVFVLNEDTIVDPGCIRALVQAGESAPDVGIVGPKVLHHDQPQVIQSAGGTLGRYWRSLHRGENEPDHGQFDSQAEVDWVSGCSIFVRAEAVRRAGMLDERYFYYWEETEWCIRVRRHGYRILYAPAATLQHKGVQVDYRPKPVVGYYNTRNRLMTLAKHHAPVPVRVMAHWEIARTLASYSLRPKWRARRESRDWIWRGLRDYYAGRSGMAPSR